MESFVTIFTNFVHDPNDLETCSDNSDAAFDKTNKTFQLCAEVENSYWFGLSKFGTAFFYDPVITRWQS